MQRVKVAHIIMGFIIMSIATSCIKVKDLYKGTEGGEDGDTPSGTTYSTYLYPFNDEAQDVVAEITIQSGKEINLNGITAEIPCLKYNKSLLLMLSQDDCSQTAYCRTWAVINGKPVSSSEPYVTDKGESILYFDAAHLRAGDLPPTVIPANGCLGSTDGCGNEVRFAFTSTLAPEEQWMDAKVDVSPGFSEYYYRFNMKSGLVWDNVREIVNYGNSIAFHDVKASDINDAADILRHYPIAQDTILRRLSERGCKMLAEPNGNKTYVTAALGYPEIQTMVAQAGTERLYPFKVADDLKGKLLHRSFDTPEEFKTMIASQLNVPEKEREAIHMGVHTSDNSWTEFLRWINDNYGKNGNDCVWFPSQEEYYEYNYYRIHGSTKIEQIDKNSIKLTVSLPSGKYFYYPSVSINLTGIKKEEVSSLSSNSAVSGLSYGNHGNGITLNIDCRKHLEKHATHFVEEYEKDKSDLSKKADASYFVNMLKESAEKTSLLNRIK